MNKTFWIKHKLCKNPSFLSSSQELICLILSIKKLRNKKLRTSVTFRKRFVASKRSYSKKILSMRRKKKS